MRWYLIFVGVVFGTYFWRQYRQREAERNNVFAADRLGIRHIGDVVVLDQPVQNGRGHVKLGNRQWPVRGPNLPVGAKVRVTGVDGPVLLVDRMAG
jgi:membrane protein implicated in regulation of membrane protease activity